MSFQNLKKNSGNLDKLAKALEKISNNESSNKEDNFWKPATDKVGNGYAVIRFLPAPEKDGEDALPWAKLFSHGFQGPGGWLIDNCLTTKDENCPICEHNSTLWNTGSDANKEIVRKQKRKLSYIANVYIVEDSKHPENVGKVFLFKFGKKIFDKISFAMNPEFEDEKPINPFDLWKGANFKLKIRKVEGYSNYDKSEFDTPGPLLDDDDAMEKVWKSEYSLKELIKPEEFKTYDQLKARLNKVLGLDGAPAPTTMEKAKAEPRKPKKESEDSPFVSDTKADSDDEMEWFKSLAEE